MNECADVSAHAARFLQQRTPGEGRAARERRAVVGLYTQHMDNSHYAGVCFVMICSGITLSLRWKPESADAVMFLSAALLAPLCVFQLRAKWRQG